MDLPDAVVRYPVALFERGVAGVVLLWAVITAVRWWRHGWRTALSLSVPEVLIAVGVVAIWAFTLAPTKSYLPGDTPPHVPVNLVPILPLIADFSDPVGWRFNVPNLVVNLMLYAPIGFGLRWRFGLRVWWILLIAAVASTAVEISQAFSDQERSPDINDVLLNTISALAGAWIFMAVSWLLRARSKTGRKEPAQPEAVR